ncbi:MAG: ABC transporter permease subunit [Armatimonadota bacterium]
MSSMAIAFLSVIETMRRKEFYVVLVMVLGLAIWMAVLDLASPGAGRFAKHVIMQVAWLASLALAASLSARQIPTDLEQKTVYVLMSRPINRWQYVFGRIAGAAAASVACFTSLFLVLILMLLVKGASGIADPSLWQAFVLQVASLVMVCATAVLFSIFGTSAGAVTFTLMIYAIMRYWGYAIPTKLANLPAFSKYPIWFIYLISPHYEFMDISQRVVHSWGALPVNIFVSVLMYAVVYSVFVSSLAAWSFRKRWI